MGVSSAPPSRPVISGFPQLVGAARAILDSIAQGRNFIAQPVGCREILCRPRRDTRLHQRRYRRRHITRGEVTKQELRTLHGIITELGRGRSEG